jgi:hypothetical protein
MQRSFLDLSETDIADIEKAAFFARGDFRGAVRWDDLLKSPRVLIVSEAGAGKTYECQEQQKRLWNAGEPAFFLDLATLANSSVRDMLTAKQEARLDQWLTCQPPQWMHQFFGRSSENSSMICKTRSCQAEIPLIVLCRFPGPALSATCYYARSRANDHFW